METTLALALLLAAGFLAAKAAQAIRLPSVTGYIVAGVVMGPSCLNAVTEQTLEHDLGHFTTIALMLIAFGIGEHLDLAHLRHSARSVGYIGVGETSGAFWLVGVGTFFVARATGVGEADWGLKDFVALALLLGAVSVATAPAATLHVMRELRAAGPLTKTLMAVVALDDGLAIIAFGIAMTAAHHVVGSGAESIFAAVGGSVLEIVGSLCVGIAAGLLIDLVVHRLRRRGEMLTVGLALLLLCGAAARLLHLSELLAGMAAGFTIVNRDRRDVRVFRAINDFEPPIYALFFTLAGAHLDLRALAAAGWVGVAYSLLRIGGKMLGCAVGARVGKAAPQVARYLGLALTPQAGVAIGLIFLIQSDETLGVYSSVVTPVVLAGVVFAELVGPVLARTAVVRAGEVGEEAPSGAESAPDPGREETDELVRGVELVPWTWDQLRSPEEPGGSVVFGASNPETVAGLARMASLLAYHHGAQPLAVHVALPGAPRTGAGALLAAAQQEARSLGMQAATQIVEADSIPEAIVGAARQHNGRAILLGHPPHRTSREFDRVVEAVGRDAPCPVIVVRLVGVVHTERILVPVISLQELEALGGIVLALSAIGPHRVTLFRMMQSDALEEQLEGAEQQMLAWSREVGLIEPVMCQAAATESRLDALCEAAAQHDLIVMAARRSRGLQRLFFGSLAEDVIQRCRKPVLVVRE
jgi:Kef-type K+ transport system membrane component KefB/nucleotide-binding universal stress UspA family protein